MAIFCGGLFLLVLSLFVVTVLQSPFEVENEQQALR
jgi:hypothetical protein